MHPVVYLAREGPVVSERVECRAQLLTGPNRGARWGRNGQGPRRVVSAVSRCFLSIYKKVKGAGRAPPRVFWVLHLVYLMRLLSSSRAERG